MYIVQNQTDTGIGRKNETDYYLQYTFKSFRDIPNLVSNTQAVHKYEQLGYTEKKLDLKCPKLLVRVLKMSSFF